MKAKTTKTQTAPATAATKKDDESAWTLGLVKYQSLHPAPDKCTMMASIELTRGDMEKIGRATAGSRLNLSDILKIGLAAMKKCAPYGMEREDAMMQSNALLTLLYRIIEAEDNGGSVFPGRRDKWQLLAGLQSLVWATRDRLKVAVNGPEVPED